eukprot:2217496-Amphidinium_carterae.1
MQMQYGVDFLTFPVQEDRAEPSTVVLLAVAQNIAALGKHALRLADPPLKDASRCQSDTPITSYVRLCLQERTVAVAHQGSTAAAASK